MFRLQNIFILFFTSVFILQEAFAQQTIGEVPEIEGGKEDMTTTPAIHSTSYSTTQAQWTRWDLDTYTYNSSGGRSGPVYLTIGEASATSRLRSSNTGATGQIAQNTQYVFQFYYKSAGQVDNLQVYLQPTGTTTLGTGTNIGALSTAASWTKVTGTVTSANNVPDDYGHYVFRFSGASGNSIDIDDVCIYAGSAADNTAPGVATNARINAETYNSLYVSWTAPSGGVEGGGYMVVRGTSDPTSAPATNGIYENSNNIVSGQIVVYLGTSTGFTNTGLSAGTTYYYRVYTIDKAFNYSSSVAISGSTRNLTNNADFRTVSAGDFSDNANWEEYVSGIWTANATRPSAGDTAFIEHEMLLNESRTFEDLVITNGDALLIDNNTARTLTINGDISSAGTFRPVTTENAFGQSTVKTHTLIVKGNINNTGTFTTASDRDGAATTYKVMRINVSLEGSTSTTFPGQGTVNLYATLTINKTSGNVTLDKAITHARFTSTESGDVIDPQITLTSGNLITTSSNLYTLDYGGSTSGGSSSSYVSGPMAKNTNTTSEFIFPLGKNSRYVRASVKPTSTNSSTFTAEYFDAAYSNTSTFGAGVNHVSYRQYWQIDRSGATPADALVKLYWDANSNHGGVDDTTQLIVCRWDGSAWQKQGDGNILQTSSTAGTTQSETVTSFSPFTLGSSGTNNPLPIELIFFSGKVENNTIDLNWATASEINNDYFTIERSLNAIDFEEALIIDGAGNSSHTIYYSVVDESPLEGTSYYRLKQTDFDGKYEYSKVVPVYFDDEDKFRLLSTQVDRDSKKLEITFTSEEKVTIICKIFDITGRQIFSAAIEPTESINTFSVDFQKYKSGIYLINILAKDNAFSLKFLYN